MKKRSYRELKKIQRSLSSGKIRYSTGSSFLQTWTFSPSNILSSYSRVKAIKYFISRVFYSHISIHIIGSIWVFSHQRLPRRIVLGKSFVWALSASDRSDSTCLYCQTCKICSDISQGESKRPLGDQSKPGQSYTSKACHYIYELFLKNIWLFGIMIVKHLFAESCYYEKISARIQMTSSITLMM